MYFENDLSLTLSLDGDWDFKLGDSDWGTIPVPAAWEAHRADKLTDGPALYRRSFTVSESWLSSAVFVLEADAISFDATISLNGQLAGHHQGLWSAFQIDLKPFVQAGENTIEIEVWKPGKRFPVRETLSGFLPDVATTFGGLWQGLRLRVFSWAALDDVRVFTHADGLLDVQGKIVGLGERRKNEIVVDVLDAHGQSVARTRADIALDLSFAAHLQTNRIHNWAPNPEAVVYSVRIALRAREADIARVSRLIGFRDLEIVNDQIRLNDAPQQLRGVLSWGWDAERIAPFVSGVDAVESFDKARTLGFNLFKLCLFVPNEALFNAADQAGMLLWLELPMWLPKVTPALRELALHEYRELFARLHHHPSIAIISLGCELNAQADAEFLGQLSELAHDYFPNALHCDNSGSAEAYGGVATTLSEFYDYHFYTDPHFFQPLVQHFHRAYQPNKPWLYGEFCDADTFRDFSLLDSEAWWLTPAGPGQADSTALDRADFVATRAYAARLQQTGITDSGAALTEAARHQATEIRKYLVEQVRLKDAVGGYVITGWNDTPITTSGIVDDQRVLKFSGDEWRRFNTDRVLLIDRERRRQWIGGDRPLFKDPFTWQSGELAEIHLILSNGGAALGGARLGWRLMSFTSEVASGDKLIAVEGGEVREVATFSTRLPIVEHVTELRLIATLTDEDHSQIITQNIWKIWIVPLAPETVSAQVAYSLAPDLLDRVRAGETLTIWVRDPDPRFTQTLAFWRESIHVFNDHPLWNLVLQPGFADLRFFSIATDFAIDLPKLAGVLGSDCELKPVWRRFDARQMFWAEYIVEAKVGAGRLLISTLRFAGGLGSQPNGLAVNPMGAWMLANLK